VSHLSEFGINIRSLENREYVFEYTIDDLFFGNFENAPVSRGKLNCKAVIDKTSSFIRVNLLISGAVELVCDRSLDPFDYPVNTTGQWVYKFGDEEMEIDEEISIIARNRHDINLAQNIYELISVAIPMKKLHPRYDSEEEQQDEMVYTTGSKIDPDEEPSAGIDPRWEILKKLKIKNKN
jgi:uncharacterized metal-binding protein YceD (DUF177 family)